jgi:hypothetical protein
MRTTSTWSLHRPFVVDMVRVRLEIFRRTRSHSYTCLIHGGSWGRGFDVCGCDNGNKKQYLRDILLTAMAKGEHAELR